MDEDERGSVVTEGVFHDLPGIDGRRIHGAFKKRLFLDDLVFRVKEEYLEVLFLQVAKRMIQVIEDFAGRAAIGTAHHPVLEKTAGHLLDEPNAENVMRADALDLPELMDVRLEDPTQRPELSERFFGLLLAIPPGRPQGQKKLDDLIIKKSVESAAQEFLSEAPTVAFTIMLRKTVFIRRVFHEVHPYGPIIKTLIIEIFSKSIKKSG
jgi:hypothetical protein